MNPAEIARDALMKLNWAYAGSVATVTPDGVVKECLALAGSDVVSGYMAVGLAFKKQFPGQRLRVTGISLSNEQARELLHRAESERLAAIQAKQEQEAAAHARNVALSSNQPYAPLSINPLPINVTMPPIDLKLPIVLKMPEPRAMRKEVEYNKDGSIRSIVETPVV